MVGGYIYVAYSPEDAGEVAEITGIIRDQGWSICYGHLAEPGDDDQSISLQRIAAASCVLVVWSSNAVWSSLVRSDALEAARQNKLLMVKLDDVILPVPQSQTLFLADWRDAPVSATVDVLLTRIAERAGPAGRGKGRSIPYVYPATMKPVVLGAIAAAGMAAGILLAIPVTQAFAPPGTSPVVAAGHEPPAGTADLVAATQAGPPPDWDETTHVDLSTVRARGTETREEVTAPKELSMAQRLEQFAWQGVGQHDDFLVQLDAITSFQLDFPDGVHRKEASDLERQRRTALATVQSNLQSLGFLAQTDGHDSRSTREAVRAFEQSAGASPSGRVTDQLVAALTAAVVDKTRLPPKSH